MEQDGDPRPATTPLNPTVPAAGARTSTPAPARRSTRGARRTSGTGRGEAPEDRVAVAAAREPLRGGRRWAPGRSADAVPVVASATGSASRRRGTAGHGGWRRSSRRAEASATEDRQTEDRQAENRQTEDRKEQPGRRAGADRSHDLEPGAGRCHRDGGNPALWMVGRPLPLWRTRRQPVRRSPPAPAAVLRCLTALVVACGVHRRPPASTGAHRCLPGRSRRPRP